MSATTPIADPTRAEASPCFEGLRVAYMMSRFPKLTETFILYELLAVEELGVRIEVYPLMREKVSVIHADAARVTERAHFLPFLSGEILAAQLRWLRKRPGAYLGALWDLVRTTWGSANFCLGGLAHFPRTARFAELMQQHGIQHLHAHFANHPAAAAFIVHRLTGIPYSFTAHGSDLHMERRMLREKVADAAFVVAISDYNRRMIVDECRGTFAERVVVIHCGVDTRVFQAPERPARAPGEPFRIVCTGTLHEVKGQTYLIDACRLLKERGVGVLCQLIGEGEDRPMLERQIREAGLEDEVRLLGRQTRDQVAAVLAAADVVVAPSVPTRSGKREGIPVALMEAMATGMPVVASDLSGIPELVRHEETGLLAPPRDAAALADALARLESDPELRARLGRAARARVERDFDQRTNARLLAERILAVVQGQKKM